MTDRIEVPERVSQRAKSAHRGARSGGQAVGDYVGHPAGEAAQAVRRAGLRPGLDRSFGCPAELTGLVVAQDPVPGSEMARNGIVTLYVAAPGGEPVSTGNDAAASSGQPVHAPTAKPRVEQEPSTVPATPTRGRRRKPGHARRPIEPSPTPAPAPATSFIEEVPTEDSFRAQGVERVGAWPTELDAPERTLDHELAEERRDGEFPHEDFVVHAEDLLAGRSRLPGSRRAYPRQRRGNAGRFRVWLRGHRLLAAAVGLALLVWTVAGVASTPERHHPNPMTHRRTTRMVAQHVTARVRRATPVQASSTARRRAVRRRVPARHDAVVPRRSQAPAPQPPETSAPAVSTPAEQRGGGLFSP